MLCQEGGYFESINVTKFLLGTFNLPKSNVMHVRKSATGRGMKLVYKEKKKRCHRNSQVMLDLWGTAAEVHVSRFARGRGPFASRPGWSYNQCLRRHQEQWQFNINSWSRSCDWSEFTSRICSRQLSSSHTGGLSCDVSRKKLANWSPLHSQRWRHTNRSPRQLRQVWLY